MEKERCFICKGQHREEDLLKDYKRSCLLCGRLFCWPHHSANPVEMGFGLVKRALYLVTWQRDWVSGALRKGVLPQWELCMMCGLQKPLRVLNPAEWEGLQKACEARGLSRFCFSPDEEPVGGRPLLGSS